MSLNRTFWFGIVFWLVLALQNSAADEITAQLTVTCPHGALDLVDALRETTVKIDVNGNRRTYSFAEHEEVIGLVELPTAVREQVFAGALDSCPQYSGLYWLQSDQGKIFTGNSKDLCRTLIEILKNHEDRSISRQELTRLRFSPELGKQSRSSGIYWFRSKSGKIYLGKSVRLAQRWTEHILKGKLDAADLDSIHWMHVDPDHLNMTEAALIDAFYDQLANKNRPKAEGVTVHVLRELAD